MKPAAYSVRTSFLVLLAIAVLLAALGVGLWSLSAAHYRRVINAWIDAQRTVGYAIAYEGGEVTGFPRHVTMNFSNVHWRDQSGIDFRAEKLDLSTRPWRFKNFDARLTPHASLSVPMEDGRALLLAGDSIRAHVSLDSRDRWREARIAMLNGRIGLTPNHLFQAERLNALVIRPDVQPKNHREVGLTIEGAADKIDVSSALPTPFGPSAAHASARLRIMGALPDVRSRASVDAWNKDSGIIEFDDFSLGWGVLGLASKGTLGFDDDLQPEGAFAGSITNPERTMEALMDYHLISARDMSMISSAMNLFAKQSGRGMKKQEFPITVQMGGLFFGPIRIFTFPGIEWANEPPVPVGGG